MKSFLMLNCIRGAYCIMSRLVTEHFGTCNALFFLANREGWGAEIYCFKLFNAI